MFNKLVKSIRWVILAGMLYTLYAIILKDDIEINSETDEKVLTQMAQESDRSKEVFLVQKRLLELNADNKEYQDAYFEAMKVQAGKLIDAHEKMLFPMPLGNYRYVKNVRFVKTKDAEYALLLNLTTIFDQKLDKQTQETLKKMFIITHNGMYKHYGFEKGMKLFLAPTFNDPSEFEVIDLNRTVVELPELGGDTNPDILPQN